MKEKFRLFEKVLNGSLIGVGLITIINFIAIMIFFKATQRGWSGLDDGDFIPFYMIWYILLVIAISIIIWRKKKSIDESIFENYKKYLGFKVGSLFVNSLLLLLFWAWTNKFYQVTYFVEILATILVCIFLSLLVINLRANDKTRGFLGGFFSGLFTILGLIITIPIIFMGTCLVGVSTYQGIIH